MERQNSKKNEKRVLLFFVWSSWKQSSSKQQDKRQKEVKQRRFLLKLRRDKSGTRLVTRRKESRIFGRGLNVSTSRTPQKKAHFVAGLSWNPFPCLFFQFYWAISMSVSLLLFLYKKIGIPVTSSPSMIITVFDLLSLFLRALRRPFPVLFQKKSFFLNLMNPPDFFPLSDKKIC